MVESLPTTMVKHYKAEVFDKNHYELAEAPFYDERSGLISYVDILNNKFYTVDKDNNKYCFDAGQMICLLQQEKHQYILESLWRNISKIWAMTWL